MTIDLYYDSESSQVQAFQMVATALGIELNLKGLDMDADEHLTPAFLKLNPQHTVPTLVDGDFAVWETRVILTYLIEKYGKSNDPLYPSDARQRATINQRLYFDMGSVYNTFTDHYTELIKKQPLDETNAAKIEKVFGFLDTFLDGADYVAGSQLTVADIALFTSVSLFAVVAYEFGKFANVTRWFAHLRKTAPGREHHEAGMESARKYLLSLE